MANKNKPGGSRGSGSTSSGRRSDRRTNTVSSNVSAVTRQVSNVSDEGREQARSRTRTNSTSSGEDNILVVNTNFSSPVRSRSNSQPVDLDEMIDNMVVSPADTYDTVPMNHTRSFNSNYSDPESPQNRQNLGSDGSYLPVSLRSPSNNNNSSSNSKDNGNEGNSNTSKVVIEHKYGKSRAIGNNGGGGSGGAGGLFCLLKSLLPVLLIVALCAGAASVYGWLFKFPTLNKQVKALEEQVVRLNSEIDRLANENDRYENLNDRLNGTVWELEDVAEDLNMTVYQLEDVAYQLNITKDDLIQEINSLQSRNQEYQLLNQGLSSNVQELANEVQYFQDSLQSLSDEHSILKNTTNALQELANQFANTTINQNETLTVLKQTLNGFSKENDRLEQFNTNLMDGLSYLNTTLAQGIDTSLEEITLVLGKQVQQQQILTIKQLEISYRQIIENWDCNYNVVFNNQEFGSNYNIPIPITSTDTNTDINSINILPLDVRDYIQERVLSKLCLNIDDFSNYLNNQYSNTDGTIIITSNQLIRSTVLYANEALNYYFSKNTGIGDGESSDGGGDIDGDDDDDDDEATTASNEMLLLSDWINAGFRCELLEIPFIWNYENNDENMSNNINLL